ncbi:MAG TPA: hypothetical protein VLJ37_02105 [bacterium]|nr:hypothetical protein [bacterium]
MSRRTSVDDVLTQIRSCLDAATSRPGLVKASVTQTEGYLRGLQGLAWETPAASHPSPDDPAAVFLDDVRRGKIALRGRLKQGSAASLKAFLHGVCETFPEAEDKPFLRALGRLWVRWSEGKEDTTDAAHHVARRLGERLKQEFEEGVAGDLSVYLLDDRLHLRSVRDYLRMRGWLQGTIEHLRRRPDWGSRERAGILAGNFSSIVLRALHNADVDYAADAVARLPQMIARLDLTTKRIAAAEPEAAHFLRKNRATILTRALHSGYLDYAEQAAEELPRVLKELNQKIARLESTSPDAARNLRSNVPSAVYRALTNGRLASLKT